MHPWHFEASNNSNRSGVAELEALFNESVAEMMEKSGLNVSRVALENFPIWPVHPLAPHPFAPHPWAPHPWAPHPWSMHPWHFEASNSSNHRSFKRQESLLSIEDAVVNIGTGDTTAAALSRTKPPRRRLR